MKTLFFLCLTHILPAVFFGGCARAQDESAVAGAANQVHPHFLAQLGLSGAQKMQIKQIRQSTPKGKLRHEEILTVLTPAQQVQLHQEMAQWKAQH